MLFFSVQNIWNTNYKCMLLIPPIALLVYPLSYFLHSHVLPPNFNQALSSSLSDNPYAIIKNQYGTKVGQLVGDGAVLAFLSGMSLFPSLTSTLSFPPSLASAHYMTGDQVNSAQRTSVPTSSPSGPPLLKNPMYVCVALRGDISKSYKDFPVAGIAIATYIPFSPYLGFLPLSHRSSNKPLQRKLVEVHADGS